ncbi:hypothetical protein ACIQ9Q_39930 [Streptomyces sp. NPDC094438]|uniref:hypothetical protein n=1 Tax=Streptomyces sp. NPDC094438 TaxID=3366061 RepID=UPI00380335B0
MHPARFTQLCIQTLPNEAPDIATVEEWQGDDAPPFGFVVSFATGSRIWAQVTGGLAPGTKATDTDVPVTGPALEPVALPALLDNDGKTSPDRAEAYLTAVLTNTDNTEIAKVYGYNQRPGQAAGHPGIGLVCHNGARLFVPFVHTAQAGQDRGRNKFRLQGAF